MKSITPKALSLALSIKKSIKDHYLSDASFIKFYTKMNTMMMMN